MCVRGVKSDPEGFLHSCYRLCDELRVQVLSNDFFEDLCASPFSLVQQAAYFLMPLPNSLERLLTNPTTAARTALDIIRSSMGCFTEMEVIVMIRPQRWRCM